jgi:hypothetical protein
LACSANSTIRAEVSTAVTFGFEVALHRNVELAQLATSVE